MFEGALVSVPDMPWSYLPILFALQLPEVLLVFPSPALLARSWRWRAATCRTPQDHLLIVTLAATLPLAIAMAKRPALYNGIRHFIFVIPR